MKIIRPILSCAVLGGLLLAGGCAQLRQANASPPTPIEGQLSTLLQRAEREALASRFGAADRLLSEFAERHPGTPESVEAGLWRALFLLDPTNQTAARQDAIALLDAYLAAPQRVAHRGAASSLHRIAVALDRPPAIAAAPAPSSGKADTKADARVDDKAIADEVQRLKEELAKANAELERIKRRLAQPNP